jgi:hypothetical protein
LCSFPVAAIPLLLTTTRCTFFAGAIAVDVDDIVAAAVAPVAAVDAVVVGVAV